MKNNYYSDDEPLFVLPRYSEELKGTLNPKIYPLLPDKIRHVLLLIDNQHERDMLLLGLLTVISGCMPQVTAFYDRKWVYPNLYTFIEAPAGAGKGVLSWARLVGAPVHQLLCEETRIAREQYELQKREKAKQKDMDETILKEPPLKMLFIPTNNSASSMVQTLVENEGAGILFSTEADTLANSLAQDWGNFSDVLRCAFHHEPIDLQRRLNREYLSVADPRLSVLLTGTHGQLLRLIPNTENGLFSRFMYYSFPAVPHFRNVFHRGGADPGNAFKALGEIVLEMYLHLKALEAPLQLYLKEEDGSKFVTLFQNITQVTYKESGTPILGTVHRLGLISFRVAMVLTTFRYFTYPDRKVQLLVKIHPNDFAVATDLTLNLLFHASILVADMKDGSKQVMQQSKMMALYNKLPETFNKTEATTIAKSIGISNSTLSRYLVNHHFERLGQGKYRKISMEQPNEQMTN